MGGCAGGGRGLVERLRSEGSMDVGGGFHVLEDGKVPWGTIAFLACLLRPFLLLMDVYAANGVYE
jgi:hypothetical protein